MGRPATWEMEWEIAWKAAREAVSSTVPKLCCYRIYGEFEWMMNRILHKIDFQRAPAPMAKGTPIWFKLRARNAEKKE